MINVNYENKKYSLEYFNKKGEYITKPLRRKYWYLSTKTKKRKKPIKTVHNIYDDKQYYVYENGGETPKLTVPFKLKKNKDGIRFYDYRDKFKLQHYQKIIDDGLGMPKSITYDIETTSLEADKGFITSIAWIDNTDNSEHTVLNEGSEYSMLKEFINYIKENNITSLIGFNSYDFDDKYLSYRCNHNQLNFNPIKSCNIDVMKGANKLFITGSLSSIGKQLNIDEEKLDLGSDNPIKLYNDDRYDELLYYNLQDVRATNDIMKALNLLPFYRALWELSWCDFNQLPFNSVLNNSLANKFLWENDLVVTKVDDQFLGDFGGGFNYIINE